MKPGPKPKIGEKERNQILKNLEDGASLRNAAGAVGVDNATVFRLRKSDPEFAKGVNTALQVGKMKLIRQVTTAGTWQAAAWMLERRWGREFGRKDTLSVKAKYDHVHRVRKDVEALARDPDAMRAVDEYTRRLDALDMANTNGHEAKQNGKPRDLN